MNATERLDAIEARANAAQPGPWHWSGNIDTGEPYLATWRPGLGRCSVLAIGSEARSTTGPAADKVRATAEEFDLGDPDELVEQWAHDQYGQAVTDPRLWFYTDLMAVDARDHAVFEVAPEATSREDPSVYRADITGIRHPDAEFIADARQDVPALVAALRAVLDLVSDWQTRGAAAEQALGVTQVISIDHIATRVHGLIEEALA